MEQPQRARCKVQSKEGHIEIGPNHKVGSWIQPFEVVVVTTAGESYFSDSGGSVFVNEY